MKEYTPENERMSPEKGPFQKEFHIPTIDFQGIFSFSGGYLFLVFCFALSSFWTEKVGHL